MSAPLIASIGTTHPWNIAGVGLDARVANEYGLPHAMAVVAVSAQDSRGLHAVAPVDPAVIAAQLDALGDGVAAYRIGALVASETVRIVARYVRSRATHLPVVVDPVFAVTLGGRLQRDSDLPATLFSDLLTLPVVVTPNILEAEQLLGMHVGDVREMLAAARGFVQRGARAAFVKGGHLEGDAVDVVMGDGREHILTGPRLRGSMRGSGCTLAASLACELANGRDLLSAAEAARAYVRRKIAAETTREGLQVAF